MQVVEMPDSRPTVGQQIAGHPEAIAGHITTLVIDKVGDVGAGCVLSRTELYNLLLFAAELGGRFEIS